jgi:DNA-binding NarL/FixJ family response regulator
MRANRHTAVDGRSGLPDQLSQASPTAENATLVISDYSRMSVDLLAAALRQSCANLDIKAQVTRSEHVVEQVTLQSPQVALISANLEDGFLAGFRALRLIHRICAGTRPIMLLENRDQEQIVDAFRGGAKGVFFRTDPFEDLCKSIATVNRGQIWAGSEELEHILKAFSEASPLQIVDAKGEGILSKREEQVVALLTEGFTNREIAERMHLSQHTVKNYMFRIFDKVGVSSRVELILYAFNRKKIAAEMAA